MSTRLNGFLELTFEHETGDDLVDHFHLTTETDSKGAIQHVNDHGIESWSRESRPIGTGGFGTAWLEKEAGGKTRVVKEVRKVIPNIKTRYWVRELSTMALLSKNKTCYPEFYGWFQDESHVYIAMEHFPLGDLTHCVKNVLPQDQAALVVAQIVAALDIMHRRRITHRDLKPANVLVRHPPPRWQVAVSDFGVSKRVRGATTVLHTSFEGDFMAPEILGFVDDETSGEYTSAVDLWSLGCLAYWLLNVSMPVPRRRMMAHCNRPWADVVKNFDAPGMDEVSKDFVLSLLRPEPKQRMSATQARGHTWLKSACTGSAGTGELSKSGQNGARPFNATDVSCIDQRHIQTSSGEQQLTRPAKTAPDLPISPESTPQEPIITQILSGKLRSSVGSTKRDSRPNNADHNTPSDDAPTTDELMIAAADGGVSQPLRALDLNIKQPRTRHEDSRRHALAVTGDERAFRPRGDIWASPDPAESDRDVFAHKERQRALPGMIDSYSNTPMPDLDENHSSDEKEAARKLSRQRDAVRKRMIDHMIKYGDEDAVNNLTHPETDIDSDAEEFRKPRPGTDLFLSESADEHMNERQQDEANWLKIARRNVAAQMSMYDSGIIEDKERPRVGRSENPFRGPGATPYPTLKRSKESKTAGAVDSGHSNQRDYYTDLPLPSASIKHEKERHSVRETPSSANRTADEFELEEDSICGTATIIRQISAARWEQEQEEAKQLREEKIAEHLEQLKRDEVAEWNGRGRQKTRTAAPQRDREPGPAVSRSKVLLSPAVRCKGDKLWSSWKDYRFYLRDTELAVSHLHNPRERTYIRYKDILELFLSPKHESRFDIKWADSGKDGNDQSGVVRGLTCEVSSGDMRQLWYDSIMAKRSEALLVKSPEYPGQLRRDGGYAYSLRNSGY